MNVCRFIAVVVLAAALVSSLRAQEKGGDKDQDSRPTMGLIRDVGISADGKYAFAGDSNRTIWVWDVATRKLVRAIQDRSENQNTIPHFAFSADGRFAVVGNEEGISIGGIPATRLDRETLTFWDLKAGKRLRAFELIGEPVFRVALSPDGKRALSVSHHMTVRRKTNPKDLERRESDKYHVALRLWDTSTGKLIRTLIDGDTVGPITFSADGKFFADGWIGPKPPFGKKHQWAVGTWETPTGNVLAAKEMAAEWSHMELGDIALSPDGKNVAATHYVHMSMWNLSTGKLRWTYCTSKLRGGARFDDWVVRSVKFSRDGRQIVASGWAGFLGGKPCGDRGGIVVLDVFTGKAVGDFNGTNEWVQSVCFTPNGQMVFGAVIGGLRFWDARTGKQAFTLRN